MSDIIFQSIAWHGEDITNEEKVKEYAIKAFGMTRDGKTVSVTIKNFNPYFYVKLENNMTTDSIKKSIDDLIEARTNAWTNKKNVQKSHIVNIKTVNAKDFWGFTNNEKSQFAKISFDCNSNMKFVANKFSQSKQKVNGRIVELKCYEHNIDPYIRFIHQNNLEPTEWIIIKKGTYHENTILQTTNEDDPITNT